MFLQSHVLPAKVLLCHTSLLSDRLYLKNLSDSYFFLSPEYHKINTAQNNSKHGRCRCRQKQSDCKNHCQYRKKPDNASDHFSDAFLLFLPYVTADQHRDPIDSPVTVNTTRLTRLLPVDTAEIPAVVPNQPTIIRSTAPYIACKTSAPNIGTIKRTSFFKIFPCVKSCFVSIVFFCSFYYVYLFKYFICPCQKFSVQNLFIHGIVSE